MYRKLSEQDASGQQEDDEKLLRALWAAGHEEMEQVPWNTIVEGWSGMQVGSVGGVGDKGTAVGNRAGLQSQGCGCARGSCEGVRWSWTERCEQPVSNDHARAFAEAWVTAVVASSNGQTLGICSL